MGHPVNLKLSAAKAGVCGSYINAVNYLCILGDKSLGLFSRRFSERSEFWLGIPGE